MHMRLRGTLTSAALTATMVVVAIPHRATAADVPEDEIVFGMTGAFVTSTNKETAYQARAALEAAFAAQNERGGVHGRKLRLVSLNDSYDPAQCIASVRALVEKHDVFMVTNGGTPMAMATVPYVNQKKIPYLAAMTGSLVVRNDPPDRYVFIFRPSYAEETSAAVRYLVSVRRIQPSRIAVFSQDDAFGDAAFEGVAKIMRQLRYDPRRVLRVYYKRNTTDVEEAVKAITKQGKRVDAIIVAATFKPAARLIERLREAGLDHLLFTAVSVVGATEFSEELVQLGPSYADGVIMTQVVPDPTSNATAIMRYREELKKFAPNARPGYMSLESWIGIQIVIEALKRAGPDLTREGFVDALESIKGWDLGIGVPISFGLSEHQASHKVWGSMMEGSGKIRSLALD